MFQEKDGFNSRILFLKLLRTIFCGQNGINSGIEEAHIPTRKQLKEGTMASARNEML